MVANAPLHGLNQGAEFLGPGVAFWQRNAERRQRSFQPVRQVGDVTPRAFEIGCILPQQRVELRGKWLDFERLRLGYRLGSTCPYLGNRTPQTFQRTQTETHLQKHRSDQSNGE